MVWRDCNTRRYERQINISGKLSDAHWFGVCGRKGSESPDPRTKIGCVIVDENDNVIAEACNTWPVGIAGNVQGRSEAPDKYLWIEHAERNAIYLAARQGISTDGSRMFVDLTPCVDCARAIIQAGIAELAINRERATDYDGAKYFAEQRTALDMLAEAEVRVRLVSTKEPSRD